MEIRLEVYVDSFLVLYIIRICICVCLGLFGCIRTLLYIINTRIVLILFVRLRTIYYLDMGDVL